MLLSGRRLGGVILLDWTARGQEQGGPQFSEAVGVRSGAWASGAAWSRIGQLPLAGAHLIRLQFAVAFSIHPTP